jgi:DNA-binding MurR/RpiR family transcriptional regulator
MHRNGDEGLALIPKLRMIRPSLTKREQRILTYLLENADQAESMRITQIAETFGVSQAFVVKLAKRIGFSGFRELKAGLAEYGSSRVAELYEEVAPDDPPAEILRKLFRASMQALEETLSILSLEDFERATDLFAGASVRDIYGVGGSAAIARDTAHKFLRIGIRCNSYDDAHLMAMSAATLTKRDVVLAISHSGGSSVVIDAARIAKSRGVPIVVLTSYQPSALAALADATLVSTARSSPFTGENAAARIAQLNIIDSLFVSVAFRNGRKATEELARTMSVVEEKRE